MKLYQQIKKKLIPKSTKEAFNIQKTYRSFNDYEHIGYKIAVTSIAGKNTLVSLALFKYYSGQLISL